MQIERLRLAGFKSFVDPTELAIEPGLTGIVGPNGCGKSNLVEALRWAMGEASARHLRGGAMDDVIFAGSAGRPARNLAEVTLSIADGRRAGSALFDEGEAIEVVRRIERDGGSSYRINGREVRARDVQLLFADAATGAHSAALVSQGRVGALTAAKPAERRALLDEAAGTAGLHARRHEAELKLKAAEDNLLRLDDVLATMAAQLDGLKKQARQAQRYRRLAEQIRRTEAQLFDAGWQRGAAAAAAAAAELAAAERAVATATSAAAAEERARAAAEAELPALRRAEAAASAEAERIGRARDALAEELTRLIAARAETERRIGQIAADLAREAEGLADAEAALARLVEEGRALDRRDREDAAACAKAAAALEEAAAALIVAESGLEQMTEAAATGAAHRAALEGRRREAADRRRRLEARRGDAERQRAALMAALVAPTAAEAAAASVAEAASEAAARRAARTAAAEALAASQAGEGAALDRSREAERALARLKAEADALDSVLAAAMAAPTGASGQPLSMLSLLRVPAGYEAALAALFDDELSAPLFAQAPPGDAFSAAWIELGPLDDAASLPDGVPSLGAEVDAPPALRRRLGQTGRVDSEAGGWQLQPRLKPGQCLVDRDGRLWRWDGFARTQPGSSTVAQLLRQRNRLEALGGEIANAVARQHRATVEAATARTAREAAALAERDAAAALRRAEEHLAERRAAEADLARRALTAEARLAALNESVATLGADLAAAAAEGAEAERRLGRLPDPGLARAGLEAARSEAGAARRREAAARAALDLLAREAESRRRRIAAIAEEEGRWQKRRAAAAAQQRVLIERRQALVAELAELAARPAAIAAEGEALARGAAQAAAQHRSTADALLAGEARQQGASDGARRAEEALAQARERRARLDAQREAATHALERLRAEIRTRLDSTPEELAQLAGRDGDTSATDPGESEARLDRLLREREAIGPVNLVADSEAAEVEARRADLERERDELKEAIARLRRGIAALDQEARRRVLAAFDRLNGHFGALFARLFGGGRAQLALVDDDDPLAGGLEIMASPPGKRLQLLSLLSGGEQALTAIALIFAVFLTNPAPICVLDEVDAPLDDANVERFCRLVAETADATGTRFLLVTHHPITIARMDRLFGVTMLERGVSQLVSVDLSRAAALRQSA